MYARVKPEGKLQVRLDLAVIDGIARGQPLSLFSQMPNGTAQSIAQAVVGSVEATSALASVARPRLVGTGLFIVPDPLPAQKSGLTPDAEFTPLTDLARKRDDDSDEQVLKADGLLNISIGATVECYFWVLIYPPDGRQAQVCWQPENQKSEDGKYKKTPLYNGILWNYAKEMGHPIRGPLGSWSIEIVGVSKETGPTSFPGESPSRTKLNSLPPKGWTVGQMTFILQK